MAMAEENQAETDAPLDIPSTTAVYERRRRPARAQPVKLSGDAIYR